MRSPRTAASYSGSGRGENSIERDHARWCASQASRSLTLGPAISASKPKAALEVSEPKEGS